MKLKCPVCNSCLTYTWISNRRFFWCDFCGKYYDAIDGEYVEIRGFQVTEEGIKIHYVGSTE